MIGWPGWVNIRVAAVEVWAWTKHRFCEYSIEVLQQRDHVHYGLYRDISHSFNQLHTAWTYVELQGQCSDG